MNSIPNSQNTAYGSSESSKSREARRRERQSTLSGFQSGDLRISQGNSFFNNQSTSINLTKDKVEFSHQLKRQGSEISHSSNGTTLFDGSTLFDEPQQSDISTVPKSSTEKTQSTETKAFIGIDPVPGLYPDKEARKAAQWKRRIDLFKTGTAIVAALTALGIAVACPAALPAVAGGAALLHPTALKVITSSLGVALSSIGDLCGNREAFPKAKEKVLKNIRVFNKNLNKMGDSLRKIPRFKAHMLFLDRLSEILTKFGETIQDKNYEECLGVCFEFEKQVQALLAQYLREQTQIVQASTIKKEQSLASDNIQEVQEFFRKYEKYMNLANQEMQVQGEVSEKTRLNLLDLQRIQKESHIPALQEWASSEESFAYCLPRLREKQIDT